VVDLAVLGLWLDSVILKVFSNLNDSMKEFCIYWVKKLRSRNQIFVYTYGELS